MRRVYIATPINGRHDGRDFNEKLALAKKRIKTLKQVLRDEPAFKGCEFVSTFDIHHGTMPSEAKAMGDCITLVLGCDAIYLDHGWLQSRGCNLEYRAAKIYGLEIYDHDKPKRLKVLKPPRPKRRKFATEEERKAAKREYSRRWNEANRERVREYQRKRYYQKKGEEPPERSEIAEKRAKIAEKRSNPKPKRVKLTPEEKKAHQRESQRRWKEKNRERIREYQSRYYHEHKEELNTRSAERIKQTREKSREEQKPVERFLCTDCNTVKPVGDFITDGKQYKVCNECRARHTKRQELGQKPKSPHGTGDRCEYHRQYYQENREKIKAKRCESSGTPIAVTTDKRIVMLFEKGYSPNDIASRCMVGVERVKHVIEREGCRAGEARLCCDCWLYPCFDGMDSISSNLALTCQKYHRKEAAS